MSISTVLLLVAFIFGILSCLRFTSPGWFGAMPWLNLAITTAILAALVERGVFR